MNQQKKLNIQANNDNKNKTLQELLKKYKIAIPAFQREYAQGRKDNGIKNLRTNFLEVLFSALINDKKIKLDYIYGYSKENDFYLIDGQQRITTVWLLYVYIYKRNNINAEFLKNFAYYTCECVTRFTKELSNLSINLDDFIEKTKKSDEYMNEQSIYSFINMLEDIDKIYKEIYEEKKSDIEVEKLENIIFDIIDVKEEQIGENLYIKMNSRGKPLSAFENYKAWLFENDNIRKNYAKDINDKWISLFWQLDKENYDIIIMNFIDICTVYFYFTKEENPDLYKYKSLKSNKTKILQKNLYLNENSKIINENEVNIINNLLNIENINELLKDVGLKDKEISSFQKIFCMLCFVEKNGSNIGDFAEWYYSIWRVIENTRNDSESEDIIYYFKMIKYMVKYTTGKKEGYNNNLANIKEELKEIFGYEMIKEEIEKAKLIEEQENRLEYFQEAHKHHFFKGKIGFLIEICKEEGKFNDELFKKRYNQLSNDFSEEIPQQRMLQKYDYYWSSDGAYGKYVNFGKISNNTKERLQWYQKVFNDEKFSKKYFIEKKRNQKELELWESCMITYPEIFKLMENKKLYLDGNTAYIVRKSNFSKNDYNLYVYGFYLYCTKKRDIELVHENAEYDNTGKKRVRFEFKIENKKYKVYENGYTIEIYYYGTQEKQINKQNAVCKKFTVDKNSKNIDKEYDYIIENIPKRITKKN